MYIKEDYEDEDINAEAVVAKGMDWMYDNLISMQEADLDEDQTFMLAIIGASFKIVAQKARAYEEMQDPSSEFFQN